MPGLAKVKKSAKNAHPKLQCAFLSYWTEHVGGPFECPCARQTQNEALLTQRQPGSGNGPTHRHTGSKACLCLGWPITQKVSPRDWVAGEPGPSWRCLEGLAAWPRPNIQAHIAHHSNRFRPVAGWLVSHGPSRRMPGVAVSMAKAQHTGTWQLDLPVPGLAKVRKESMRAGLLNTSR